MILTAGIPLKVQQFLRSEIIRGSTQVKMSRHIEMGDFPRSGIRNKQVSDIESGYPDIESGYPDIRI